MCFDIISNIIIIIIIIIMLTLKIIITTNTTVLMSQGEENDLEQIPFYFVLLVFLYEML